MQFTRRSVIAALCLLASGCGGGMSTLVTVQRPSGDGAVDLEVENRTGYTINNFYLAETDTVSSENEDHLEIGSQAELRVWGDDQLDEGALEDGGIVPVKVPRPGRWSARVLDQHHRYQHIAGLKLGAGGKYRLRLEDGGWRMSR